MKVSVSFFCAVEAALREQHGPKMTDEIKFNQILEHLTQIEKLWQELEDEPKEKNESSP